MSTLAGVLEPSPEEETLPNVCSLDIRGKPITMDGWGRPHAHGRTPGGGRTRGARSGGRPPGAACCPSGCSAPPCPWPATDGRGGMKTYLHKSIHKNWEEKREGGCMPQIQIIGLWTMPETQNELAGSQYLASHKPRRNPKQIPSALSPRPIVNGL